MEPTFRFNRVEFTFNLPNLNFKASGDDALNSQIIEKAGDYFIPNIA
jgi:hypothetical protein